MRNAASKFAETKLDGFCMVNMGRKMDESTVACLVVAVKVSFVDLVVCLEGGSYPKVC